MKLFKLVLLISVLVFFSYPIMAQCPNPGTYATGSGTLLPGRVSEAWCGGGGMYRPGVPGNTENAQSWGSSYLGAQWKAWGMYIDQNGANETGRSFDENGNGWIDYETNYLGGQFWLTKNHLWGDGVHDLTGQISYFNVNTRVSYINWEPVGQTSNVFLTGTFNNCPNCILEYTISNVMLTWRSDFGTTPPSNYPPFLCGDPASGPGELFDACCILSVIRCGVGTEESTWGVIKDMYK